MELIRALKIFHSIDILLGPVNTKDTDIAIKSSVIESKPLIHNPLEEVCHVKY